MGGGRGVLGKEILAGWLAGWLATAAGAAMIKMQFAGCRVRVSCCWQDVYRGRVKQTEREAGRKSRDQNRIIY